MIIGLHYKLKTLVDPVSNWRTQINFVCFGNKKALCGSAWPMGILGGGGITHKKLFSQKLTDVSTIEN